MQELKVLIETQVSTGGERLSFWFDLPIDLAEFEAKLDIRADSEDYRIIEKEVPFADEVHEQTNVYQLNELAFMYRRLPVNIQEAYITLLPMYERLEALYL